MASEVIINKDVSSSEDIAPQKLATPPSTVILESEDTVEKTEPTQPAGGEKEKKDRTTPEEPEGSPAPAEDASSPEQFIVGDFDMTALAEEFSKDGKLSEESYKELEENGFSRDLVDAYIRGVQQTAEDTGRLAKEHVDSILAEVGGVEKYDAMMAWAATKLSKEEQAAYDKAVDGKDPVVARLVVQGLMSRYEAEYGKPPTLVTGSKASKAEPIGGFSNRSEMIAAMADARYGNDPEYTREVESKVIRSGLMRGGRRGR